MPTARGCANWRPRVTSASLHEIVAAAIGVLQRAGLELDDVIVEFLRAKELLLVLDNCEHLLDAVGQLATKVVRRCARVRMLATSREGLGVEGEQVWPLRSLSVGSSVDLAELMSYEAVRLFVERARAVKPNFSLDGANAAAVGEICARLDGIPLAIELAAARVASMSPSEIARRLDERFRLLTGGRRSAVERHQTLRATVDWSYAALDERDRRVFDRLGAFVGGFDTDAAGAVAAGDAIEEWDVVDALADLVAKSLLVAEDAADRTTRYEMLETLRHYALERLDEHGDADALRRLHARHYAAFAEESGRGVNGPEELLWRPRIRAELDNLRAAVTWSLDASDDADAELGLRIVAGLAGYDSTLGIGDWALRALDRIDATTPGRRQVIQAAAAYRLAMTGDLPHARELATEALRDGELDDSPWPSYPSYALAYVEAYDNRPDLVLEIVGPAIEQLGDRLGDMALARLHSVAGPAAVWTGDQRRSLLHTEQALQHARRVGAPSALANSLFSYGLAVRSQDPTRARHALEEAITWFERGATGMVYGAALAAVAPIRAAAGEYVDALRALRDASAVRGRGRQRGARRTGLQRSVPRAGPGRSH